MMPDIDWAQALQKTPKQPPATRPRDTVAGRIPDIDWTAALGGGSSAAASQTPPGVVGGKVRTGMMQYATQSLLKTFTGEDFGDLYDKVLPYFNEHLPKEWQGSKAVQLAERVARAGPEVADFVTNPVGLGLGVMHIIPYTRPVAVFADRLLQGYQVIKTLPSVIEAAKDPQDMDKVGDAIKDVAMTYSIGKGLKARAKADPLFAPVASDRKMSADQFYETMRNAPPGDRLQVLNSLIEPKTKGEARSRWMYETPIVRNVAAVLDVPKPKLTAAAASWMDDRRITVNVEALRAAKFVDDWKRVVPEKDQDIRKLGYVLEGTHTADEVGLSPEAREALPAIKDWNRQVEKMLKGVYGEDLKLHDPETYLMHKLGYTEDYDINNQNGSEERSRTAAFMGARRGILRDPQLRPRIPGSTWFELLEGGVKPDVLAARAAEGAVDKAGNPILARIPEGMAPVSNNVFDLIKTRHQIAATAIANQRFANILRDTGLIVSEQKADGSIASWPRAEATALEKAVYGGRTYDDNAVLIKKPVRVHPAMQGPVESIFGKGVSLVDPITGRRTVAGWADYVRAFGKQNAVGISFFHHWAISEQVHAIQVGTDIAGKGIPRALKGTFFFDPNVYRGLKTGIWEEIRGRKGTQPPVLGLKHQISLDAVGHGLNLGTADAEGAVVKAMKESKIKPLQWLGKIHYINNRALWDFYLPGQMVHSYETILAKELAKNPARSEAEITGLKREIANHLNKVFGTEGLESMFLHPKTRFWLNYALFAPVWTFSNFRVATNAFQTEAAMKLVGRWAGGAAFAWFVSSNLANYALTGWNWGQGPAPDKDGVKRAHFMWDNPGAPSRVFGQYVKGLNEHSTDIFFGYNPNGSESYIRFGRAYRDIFNFFNDPRAFFFGKLGLGVKAFIEMTTGREPATDYQVIDRKLPLEEQLMQYTSAAAETTMPFVAQDLERKIERTMFPETVPELGASQATVHLGPLPIPLGLPLRSGITTARAMEAYDLAVRANRQDLAEEVLSVAAKNHIPRGRVLASYRDMQRKRKYTARGPRQVYGRGGEPIVQPPETR